MYGSGKENEDMLKQAYLFNLLKEYMFRFKNTGKYTKIIINKSVLREG